MTKSHRAAPPIEIHMLYQLEKDTDLIETATNSFSVTLNDNWFFKAAPNGGFMAAIAAKAAKRVLPHSTLISLNAQFLQPASIGKLDIKVDELRSGKRFSQASVTISQSDNICVAVQLICASGDTAQQPHCDDTITPDIAALRHCIRLPEGEIQFRSQVNTRIHPAHYDALQSGSQAAMRLWGWAEMDDQRPSDDLALVIFGDAFPRAMVARTGLIGWIPTLDYSVQIMRQPVPGPILCAFNSTTLQQGLIEESGQLWDSDNNLVAVCRQTAAPRIPTDRHCFFN